MRKEDSVETSAPSPFPEEEDRNPSHRQLIGWWLLLAALLGSLATFPYTLSILKQAGWVGEQGREPVSVLSEHLATDLFLSLGAVALGIRLGESVGLSLPLLVGWPPVDEDRSRRLKNALVLAAALGVGIGVLDAIAERAAGAGCHRLDSQSLTRRPGRGCSRQSAPGSPKKSCSGSGS